MIAKISVIRLKHVLENVVFLTRNRMCAMCAPAVPVFCLRCAAATINCSSDTTANKPCTQQARRLSQQTEATVLYSGLIGSALFRASSLSAEK